MRELTEFPGYYVTLSGKIFSGPKKTRSGFRELRASKCNSGYLMLDLCKEGEIIRKLVHRLIADAFIENTENKTQVNHKDGNKLNNSASNLEWCTPSENQKHSIKTGLRSAKGIKNSQCKLSESDVVNILNNKSDYKEIASLYNISLSTIYDIKNGRSWTHIHSI